jgi:hypothetical protein
LPDIFGKGSIAAQYKVKEIVNLLFGIVEAQQLEKFLYLDFKETAALDPVVEVIGQGVEEMPDTGFYLQEVKVLRARLMVVSRLNPTNPVQFLDLEIFAQLHVVVQPENNQLGTVDDFV